MVADSNTISTHGVEETKNLLTKIAFLVCLVCLIYLA